jgi:hypothetical protein
MVILMELWRGNEDTTTNAEMDPLRQRKTARHQSGVMNTCFLASNVPPDQKVEFCSSIGEILPLIL